MGAYSEVLPAKTSRKQQALDYISEYILEHGRSPAMGEIALALGVSDTRAKALVKKLAFEKMIERAAGAQRAITVPGLLERQLLERMRSMGVVVNDDFKNGDRVLPLPQGHLPLVAILEHIPDVDAGDLHATPTY
jgi:SOS-response transcriptional repressor LexA